MSVPVAGMQALTPEIQRSEMVKVEGFGTGLCRRGMGPET